MFGDEVKVTIRHSKMRVLYVSTDFNRSGAALAMIELAENMKLLENDVYLLFPGYGEAVIEARRRGLNCTVIKSYEWVKPLVENEPFAIKMKWMLKHLYNHIAVLRIAKFVRDNKIDIIHINTLWGYVGALAAKITHRPYVWHMRELLAQQGKKIRWEGFGKKLLNSAEMLIAISKIVSDNYATILQKEKIQLIYDGVEVEKFFVDDKEVLKEMPIEIVTAGGVRPHKRQKDVVKAVNLLTKKGYDLHMSIVGDDKTDYASEIKEYIRETHLQKTVTFAGEVSDIERYWGKADIGITASAFEAFGRVTVESMLSGWITITSDSGAGKEIIEDRKSGYVFRLGDVQGLSTKIEEICNNPKQASAVAKTGQKEVFAKFNAKDNALKVNKLYLSVLERYRR